MKARCGIGVVSIRLRRRKGDREGEVRIVLSDATGELAAHLAPAEALLVARDLMSASAVACGDPAVYAAEFKRLFTSSLAEEAEGASGEAADADRPA